MCTTGVNATALGLFSRPRLVYYLAKCSSFGYEVKYSKHLQFINAQPATRTLACVVSIGKHTTISVTRYFYFCHKFIVKQKTITMFLPVPGERNKFNGSLLSNCIWMCRMFVLNVYWFMVSFIVIEDIFKWILNGLYNNDTIFFVSTRQKNINKVSLWMLSSIYIKSCSNPLKSIFGQKSVTWCDSQLCVILYNGS